MDSQDSQKLTKKQKKALAFRERKGKKAAATNLDDVNDLPQPDLVLDDETPTSNEKSSVPPPKKRKREGDEGPAQDSKKKKKTDEPSAVVTVDDKAKAKAKKKQRFILFVGMCATFLLVAVVTKKIIQATSPTEQHKNLSKPISQNVPTHLLSVS